MNAILEHLDRGTLMRGDWGDGRKTACLYSALVPGAKSTENCPGEIMPQWLADVTPYLDDNVSEAGWENRMRRYGEAAGAWHVISHDRWEYVRRQWTADCVSAALAYASAVDHGEAAYWRQVQSACRAVIDALRDNRDPSKKILYDAWAAWAAAGAAAAARAARAAGAAGAAGAAAAAAGAWDDLFDKLMTSIEAEIKAAT